MSENLTAIIDKYKQYLDNVSGKSEQEIFTNFYTKVDKTIAQGWIKDTFTKTSLKDDEKSKQFRELGNQCFGENKLDSALKNYNDSLDFADYNSDNFSLALANRSAVFFARNNYKSCIKDIEICLKHGYPDDLKYKIYIRLINCYIKLSCYKKAKEIFDILQDIDLNDSQKEQVQVIEKDLLEISTETEVDIDEKIKLPQFESNKNFASASNLVKLNYTPEKGRHVLANTEIKSGDILFVEKPFSVVPIVQTNTCYHCFTTTDCPLPCRQCFTKFCSQECLTASWTSYHRFECAGSCVDVWSRVGVNYLALRMLLLRGSKGLERAFSANLNLDEFGADKFDSMYCLVNNIDKMEATDVFPHVVSAMVFTIYLQEKTDFFVTISGQTKDSLALLIGSVLLKHILQVICNATTVESVQNEFYAQFNSTEQISETGYQFSAVALYPSVSMMNHSCDPNITNYFIDDYIIVKAKVDISKGAEVFNSYGYDCKKQITALRKQELKKQHYFECECTGCTFPSKPELFHEGLKCQSCSGLSLAKDADFYQCTDCSHTFNAKNHFSYIRKAEQLFEKFERCKNLEYLKKCLELREKVFYKYNFSIYTTNLDLQTFYGETGDIKLWWIHTQRSLDMDEIILGENSLRCAMNLRLCLLILLRYLTSLNLQDKNVIDEITLLDLAGQAASIFEKMKKMFVLYYDENKINFYHINEMLQDAMAVATHILGEQLCSSTLDDDISEMYNDI